MHVVHQFLPEYTGGTEVYVADLAARLQKRGHQVIVFAGADEPGRRSYQGTDVEAVPGGLRRGPAANLLASFGDRETEERFRQVMSEFRPDVVHFHHLLGLSSRLVRLVQEASAPSCFTLHDYWFMCPKSQLIDHRGSPCTGPRAGVNCGMCAGERMGRPAWMGLPLAPLLALRERRVRRAVASSEFILTPSDFVAQMALRHGLPQERIRSVRFGVDHTGGDWKKRPPGAPLRVTYLGAIEQSKGVHVLLEAARVAKGVHVKVYGDPSRYPVYAQRLTAKVARAPVTFMGLAARDEVPGVLSETDVLVVPSLWYENAPMAIAEAHGAGVPVIASQIGALPEWVRDGDTGLLFPPGDAAALAERLRRLVEEPELLPRLRDTTTRQPAVSREAHVDEMEAIYRELSSR